MGAKTLMSIYKEIHNQGSSKELVELPELVSTQEAGYINNIASILGVNQANVLGYANLNADDPIFPLYFLEGGDAINASAVLKVGIGYIDSFGAAQEQQVSINLSSPKTEDVVASVINTATGLDNVSLSSKVVGNRLSIGVVDLNSPRIVRHLSVLKSNHVAKTSVTDIRNPLRLFSYYAPDTRATSKVGDVKPGPSRSNGDFTIPGSAGVSRGEDRTSSSLNRSGQILSAEIDELNKKVDLENTAVLRVPISVEALGGVASNYSEEPEPTCLIKHGQGKVVVATRGFTPAAYLSKEAPSWVIVDESTQNILRIHSTEGGANLSTKYTIEDHGSILAPSACYIVDEVGLSTADILSFDPENTDLKQLASIEALSEVSYNKVDDITIEFSSIYAPREPNTLVSFLDSEDTLQYLVIREWVGQDRAILGGIQHTPFSGLGLSAGDLADLQNNGQLNIHRAVFLNKGQWVVSIYDGYLNSNLIQNKSLEMVTTAFSKGLSIEQFSVTDTASNELYNYLVRLTSDQAYELGELPNITLKTLANQPLGKSVADLGAYPESNPVDVDADVGLKLLNPDNSIIDAPKTPLDVKSVDLISLRQSHAVSSNIITDLSGVENPTKAQADNLLASSSLPYAEQERYKSYLRQFTSYVVGEVTVFPDRDILQSDNLFEEDMVGRLAYIQGIGCLRITSYLNKSLVIFSPINKAEKSRVNPFSNPLHLLSLNNNIAGSSLFKVPSSLSVIGNNEPNSIPALDAFAYFDPDATEYSTIAASSIKKSLSTCMLNYTNTKTIIDLGPLAGTIYGSLYAKHICRKMYAPAFPDTVDNPYFVADADIEIFIKSSTPVPPIRISSNDLIYEEGDDNSVHINSIYLYSVHDSSSNVVIGGTRVDAYLVEYISKSTTEGLKAPNGIDAGPITTNQIKIEAPNDVESALYTVSASSNGLGEFSTNSLSLSKSVLSNQGVSISSSETLLSLTNMSGHAKTISARQEDGSRSFNQLNTNKDYVSNSLTHYYEGPDYNGVLVRAAGDEGHVTARNVTAESNNGSRISAGVDGAKVVVYSDDVSELTDTAGVPINESEIRKDHIVTRDLLSVARANSTLDSDDRLDSILTEGVGDAKYGPNLISRLVEEIDRLKESEHKTQGIISMLNSKTLYMNSAIESLLQCVKELRYVVDAYENNGDTVHGGEPVFAKFKYVDELGNATTIAPPINSYQRQNRNVHTGYLFHNLEDSSASSAGPASVFEDGSIGGVTVDDLVNATNCITENILKSGILSNETFELHQQIAGLGWPATVDSTRLEGGVEVRTGFELFPQAGEDRQTGSVPYGSYRPVYESGLREVIEFDTNSSPLSPWSVKTLVPFADAGYIRQPTGSYKYGRPTCMPISTRTDKVRTDMQRRYEGFKLRDPDDVYAEGSDIGFKIGWGSPNSASPRYNTTHSQAIGSVPDYLNLPRSIRSGTGSTQTGTGGMYFDMYFNDVSSKGLYVSPQPLTEDGYNTALCVIDDALVAFSWLVAVGIPYAQGFPVRLTRMYRDQTVFSDLPGLTEDYAASDEFIVVRSNTDQDRVHILRTPHRIIKDIVKPLNTYVPYSTDLIFREGNLIKGGVHVNSTLNNYLNGSTINIAGTNYTVVRH